MNLVDNGVMQLSSSTEQNFLANDAVLMARIARLRESVRSHKEHALAAWNACAQASAPEKRYAAIGKFTKQLVTSE